MANDFDKLEPLELKEFRIIPLKTIQQTHHPNHLGLFIPIVDEAVSLGQRVRQDESVGRAARRRGRGGVAVACAAVDAVAPVRLLLVQDDLLGLAGQLEAHL